MQKKLETVDLEQLKRDVSLLSLAASSGIELKKLANNEYSALCPFHDDKTPSLHLNASKNLFHCKACGKSGSVVDWIIFSQNVDAKEAIKILRSEYAKNHTNGSSGKINGFNGREDKSEEKEIPNLEDMKYRKALSLAVRYWHENFKNKKEGVEYLIKRGLVYGELVDAFQIGYSDGSLADVINDESIKSALEELGIIKDGREHFTGRVIFPVIDEKENILQIYGRNTVREGVKHLYMKAPMSGIYNISGLSNETILCESILDALSLISLGFSNVVSSFGVNGIKEDVLDLLENRGVHKIYIAYDSDSAGDTGSSVLSEKFISRKIESYRIRFPENTDANDLLKNPDARELFRGLLENAVPIKELADEALVESSRNESLEKKDGEYRYRVGPRSYTIRGIESNTTNAKMRIFLRLDCNDIFLIDNNIDLFNAKTTGYFVKSASERLSMDERVIRADLDRLTNGLDGILKKAIEERESKKNPQKIEFHKDLILSQKSREFLNDPLFMVRFVRDIETAGLVGESLNMLFSYIASLSRHRRKQIHIIIQSESSAGKSTLLNLSADLIPEEDKIYFTQITPRSLYYGPPGFLKNKCIFIAEADGLKEAEFPVKQLMSEGRLSISYTKTDPQTGEHTSEIKENEGPSQFNITEPQERLHEEIENRSVVMILDMSPEQTERILAFQRLLHSPEGIEIQRKKEEICNFYRHVQREILSLDVQNPYSRFLSFNAKSHLARRDNQKYLTLVDCITLIFQHQREKVMDGGSMCVKTQLADIAIANFLARRIFARTLDELPIQTRNFVETLADHFRAYAKKNEADFDQIWFYRREMREITGLSNTRVHEHTNRLVDFEYLAFRRDQNGISYRFLFEPNTDRGFFTTYLKLCDMEELIKKSTRKERQEYTDFIPRLKEIFSALDPTYTGGEV